MRGAYTVSSLIWLVNGFIFLHVGNLANSYGWILAGMGSFALSALLWAFRSKTNE